MHTTHPTPYCIPFNELGLNDVAVVGGKNSSLGEMFRNLIHSGVKVPDGFASTADAFRLFLSENRLEAVLQHRLAQLLPDYSNLHTISEVCRQLVLEARMPEAVGNDLVLAYENLCSTAGREVEVAVRSSATAEDLPQASFAGQHDSFLNICGKDAVVAAVQRCFASLYNARAIKYRIDNGFDHNAVAISAGVQIMVRSDLGGAGTCFTLEPETGFRDVIAIHACWGLGENIVLGAVNPDEFIIHKPTLQQGFRSIVGKRLGDKAKTMVYAGEGEKSRLQNTDTPADKRLRYVLNDEQVLSLARAALHIEAHYGRPMDIEWALDGQSNEMWIVQARPETVHANDSGKVFTEYSLENTGEVLAEGLAVGTRIASGRARILSGSHEAAALQEGEVLITDITNPDWDPILKKAAAIVTNKGGRTSHAAIVARELGAVAVVGTLNGTETIRDGEEVTVSCAEGQIGHVYKGKVDWKESSRSMETLAMPKTPAMLILGDPDRAWHHAMLPHKGVGLLRLEFIISNSIGIHPMALLHPEQISDPEIRKSIEERTAGSASLTSFFVDKLALAVGSIAAAAWPYDAIVRMSDFKSNEYANLLGGSDFEPEEENPMIGFRGASRYYDPQYEAAFRLECAAMQKVRSEMGLKNVKLMIPFCRTPEEGRKVLDIMADCGLVRGEDGLQVYVMAEIPSNILRAADFAELFDGFSIGSNDLTQLTLGLDRDSALVARLFNELDPAVIAQIETLIATAHRHGRKVGLCGQAPSDHPEFARMLIRAGIDSISFNPDALFKGLENMHAAEQEQSISDS
jgi:pyruvate,water dikinase